MKETDVKSIAGIQYVYPSELKEQIYKRYSSPHELGICDRDTLRQFAKVFGADTRKLKKEELVNMVWGHLQLQIKKTAASVKFLIDMNAPVNASDIANLMGKDLSPQTICDCILASLDTYRDHKGHIHKYEDSTIVKTYLPKINRALLEHGVMGKAVSRIMNNKMRPVMMEVNQATNSHTVKLQNDLKPISESAVLMFIESAVAKCAVGGKADWMVVGLALGLMTGRRIAEIFGDSTFTKIDDTHIEFSGQMKTRGTRDDKPYVIPVVNADEVMVLLEYLTNAGKRGKTASYVNATITPGYSRAPHLIKPLGLDFFKDSRVVYALYQSVHDKPANIALNAYLGRILGHGAEDLGTSNSYQKFNLVD